MNVRDLTPGTRVVLILNTPDHAADHVSPQPVEYVSTYDGGVIVNSRGVTVDIPWDSMFYIADPRTLSAYVLPADDPDLRGTPPELE